MARFFHISTRKHPALVRSYCGGCTEFLGASSHSRLLVISEGCHSCQGSPASAGVALRRLQRWLALRLDLPINHHPAIRRSVADPDVAAYQFFQAGAVLLEDVTADPHGVLGEKKVASILYVDDEPHVAYLKAAILEAAGHIPSTSLTSQDAICRLRSNAYDMVLTGWNLERRAAGQDVICAAKAQGLPVIVISGDIDAACELASPPADLYLEKPVNPEILVNVINEMICEWSRMMEDNTGNW